MPTNSKVFARRLVMKILRGKLHDILIMISGARSCTNLEFQLVSDG